MFFGGVIVKYSPDAYLLYESNKFITFNIRVKVVMKDTVDSELLTLASKKAFKRFPYYSKQIHIDKDGGVDLIHNPRTICVSAVSPKKTYLFSSISKVCLSKGLYLYKHFGPL